MTYIPNAITEKTRFLKIFQQMTSMERAHSPLDALVKMQTEQGIDENTAKSNALRCMAAVAGREAVYEEISEDAMASMDRFFEKLAGKDEAERLQALHRIYFGLTIHSKPDSAGFAGDVELMFQHYLAQETGSENPPSAAEMEDRIRQALQQYHISPAAMKMLAHKLKKTDGCMATAMALGENGRNLKCLMTMDLWLNNQGTMSMEEAANVACTNADYQAVADAVNKGYIARDVAMKILKVVAITALVVGVFSMLGGLGSLLDAEFALHRVLTAPDTLMTTEMAADFLTWGIDDIAYGFRACFFGGAAAALSKHAASLIGSVSAWIAGLFHRAEEAAPAVDTLVDVVEEEASFTEAKEAPAPAHPVQDAPVLSDDHLFEADEEEDDDEDLIGF